MEHAEAAKARIPDVGTAAGIGKQGRIVPAGKTLLTQHLMKQRVSAWHVRQRPARIRF